MRSTFNSMFPITLTNNDRPIMVFWQFVYIITSSKLWVPLTRLKDRVRQTGYRIQWSWPTTVVLPLTPVPHQLLSTRVWLMITSVFWSQAWGASRYPKISSKLTSSFQTSSWIQYQQMKSLCPMNLYWSQIFTWTLTKT